MLEGYLLRGGFELYRVRVVVFFVIFGVFDGRQLLGAVDVPAVLLGAFKVVFLDDYLTFFVLGR